MKCICDFSYTSTYMGKFDINTTIEVALDLSVMYGTDCFFALQEAVFFSEHFSKFA